MARVGRAVVVLPDTEPDFYGVIHAHQVDGFKNELGLVAVCSVESDDVRELGENSYIACDVVLRRCVS